MNVAQAIELAKEWVEVNGSLISGFCAAHLMGGLTYTPKDAEFPAYRDIDLNIVLQDAQNHGVQDLLYQGRILEVGSASIENYRSPEAILSNVELASNLAEDSILLDPAGMLAGLHRTVANEYSKPKWVIARCDRLKNSALQSLTKLSQTSSPVDTLFTKIFLVLDLAGMVAVAGIRPPTHRRCLILMKDILAHEGQMALYEETLDFLGFGHLSQPQVASFLRDCEKAFDKAVQVTTTPVPFQFKLHPFIKPYIIEGAKEMVDEGNHREAMGWITVFMLVSNMAIQNDAAESEKPAFKAMENHLIDTLGLLARLDEGPRLYQAHALIDRVFKVTDDIVSCIKA